MLAPGLRIAGSVAPISEGVLPIDEAAAGIIVVAGTLVTSRGADEFGDDDVDDAPA